MKDDLNVKGFIMSRSFINNVVKLETLGLTNRTYLILRRAGIDFVNQLETMTEDELMRLKGMGKVTCEEIRSKLAQNRCVEDL